MTTLTRKIASYHKDFFSWSNLWLFAQAVFIIEALRITFQSPIQIPIVAFVAVWMIYQTQKF